MRFKLPYLVAGAVAAALSLAVVPAYASTTAAAAQWAWHTPSLITAPAPSLFPEAVDFDARRDRFVVGSVSQGTVSTVALNGTVTPLVADSRLVSVVGVRVDAARDRVLVSNLATDNSVSGLGSFDLATGRAQWYVDLAAVAGDGGPHFTNDVTVGADGTAYVVDGVSSTLFQVDRRGHGSVLLRDDRLGPNGSLPGFQPHFGTTTIAWLPGDLLIVGKMDGTLWRIPVPRPHALSQITVSGTIGVFIDGARTFRDGDLGVVTNGWFGAPGSVQRLHLSHDARTATVVSTQLLTEPLPTGITPGPHGTTYVMSGRLDLAFQGKPSDGFTLRRVQL